MRRAEHYQLPGGAPVLGFLRVEGGGTGLGPWFGGCSGRGPSGCPSHGAEVGKTRTHRAVPA